MENIVLIGYMGCGKSSAASALSKKSGLDVLDTDDAISAHMGMSISDIFAKYGEERFRSEETELLKRLAREGFRGILSAGGGTPLREENRSLLRQLGTVVWLTAAPDTIADRLKHDSSRPLLAGAATREEKISRIRDMLKQREAAYAAAATHRIATDGLDVNGIAEQILGIFPA
ncbi:MAG: shikimate kinase [Lachnospiraceae bacterium]|nr:shikimate kinase [Lachnospiraceae bacterium]